MPGNYSFAEYILLIAACDSLEEIHLIEEQLKEDQDNGTIDIMQYIRLKLTWTLRLTDITIEEAKKKI